jgi:phosphoribosylamine--glycine ligase
MRVLIVGSGGREHALAWKIAQSALVKKVYCAPGNAGTASVAENIDISSDNIDALIQFATITGIGLTIVGPEQPLVKGIVDSFEERGLRIFGPSQRAAEIEGSKIFCKDLMKKYGIPTARYESFDSSDKVKFFTKDNEPVVVKASGLAAGKGVILCNNVDEARAAVQSIMKEKAFGSAGDKVVVEEFLIGQEVSLLAFTDGKTVLALDSAQDHKAAFDGDKGPNTGGMGAYSPAPVVSDLVYENAMEEIIKPTVDAMKNEGMPYTGFLYAGLMISQNGDVKVLEYNCRFGDPETQPIMMRLKSNLANLCLLGANGSLANATAEWDSRSSLGVVMAAKGYPYSYQKGDIISLPESSSGAKVFHAGTVLEKEQILSNGGRVLCATALGKDLKDAQDRAYKLVNEVKWRGSYSRTDIGFKGL